MKYDRKTLEAVESAINDLYGLENKEGQEVLDKVLTAVAVLKEGAV